MTCAIWATAQDKPGLENADHRPPAVTTVVPAPAGRTVVDVCADYGVPAHLCDLSERCASQTPGPDGRVTLVLRSQGDTCGAQVPRTGRE
ncbi:MAG: hypothetical protein J0L52_09220 [Caulobacterales bacterium]|nr:hypothetical protein [Caulobacterales bacterium]